MVLLTPLMIPAWFSVCPSQDQGALSPFCKQKHVRHKPHGLFWDPLTCKQRFLQLFIFLSLLLAKSYHDFGCPSRPSQTAPNSLVFTLLVMIQEDLKTSGHKITFRVPWGYFKYTWVFSVHCWILFSNPGQRIIPTDEYVIQIVLKR